MTKYNELPEKIKTHLKGILASSGLPQTEKSLEQLAAKWMEKRQLFSEVTAARQMEECDSFSRDDERGALMLTYSGSLLTIGTLLDDSRWVEYASIKLRSDVPAVVKSEKVNITADIKVDECAGFTPGLLRRTSEIMCIACCSSKLSPEEQEERIKAATLALTTSFVKINGA